MNVAMNYLAAGCYHNSIRYGGDEIWEDQDMQLQCYKDSNGEYKIKALGK